MSQTFPHPHQPVTNITISTGKVVKHALAKEILAGFAAGEVDKLAETHGMNEYDKFEARHKAKKNAEQMYDDHYGRDVDYDPNNDAPQDFQGRY